jgi:hypothetical protein
VSVKDDGQQDPAKYMRLPSAKPAFLGVAWQAVIHSNQQCSTYCHRWQSHGVDQSTPPQYYIIIATNVYYVRISSDLDLSPSDHSLDLIKTHGINNINIRIHINKKSIPFIQMYKDNSTESLKV